jgi:Holliday junction resolvase
MGKINSRTKGATAERELARILGDRLGITLQRNLDQWRAGGFDLIGLDQLAIEVKRQENLNIGAWWEQARRQATGKIPILAYRQSRRPWAIVVPLDWLTGLPLDPNQTAQISLDSFVELLKKREIVSE